MPLSPLFLRFVKYRPAFTRISCHTSLAIAIAMAVAIALFFCGRHLADLALPPDSDVRAHVFKIGLLHNYLSHLSWPQWVPYWYQGIPIDQYYPPGFYFLGSLFTFVLGSEVIAYKVLLLLALAFNGLAIYYFARRFLRFDSHLATWALVVYETSTPLLVNFLYGEGPNLLGWAASITFLTIYLSRITEGKTASLTGILLPGFLLGISILIHPFPVIFSLIVVAIFHIIWLIHHRSIYFFAHSQVLYISGVFLLGGLTGLYYWLPALLTLNYSSPIYSFTQMMWPGGIKYLLAIVFLALTITLAIRFKIRGDIRLDLIIASFCVAAALGFGGTNYLPFGLGSLVQEFRFATIVIPFFGILLILIPFKFRTIHFNIGKLALALAIGLFLTALVFGLDKREHILAGYKGLINPNIKDYYDLVVGLFASEFPGLAVTLFPYFVVILFLALSLERRAKELGSSLPVIVLSGSICLMLITSFIPYIHTDEQVSFSRLYKYIDNYRKPEYNEILQSIKSGRLIVPLSKGYLGEGDSPVTFAWRWGVETVNGPYNQGDPKFFRFTVHLEWGDRWLDYEHTRENLMQESAAKYIFIRDNFSNPLNMNGISTIVSNQYGRLLEINREIFRAVKVTPVLLDVQDFKVVNEFFNILLPGGYRLVMVNASEVKPDLLDKFEYVITDDESRIPLYRGKNIFLLSDSMNPRISEEKLYTRLEMPYLAFTEPLFYRDDEANGYMWIGWDSWPGSRLTDYHLSILTQAGDVMKPYLEKLIYIPAGYSDSENTIELFTSPGFTLVKNSYFPYWQSSESEIMSTTQGFILAWSQSENILLKYRKPFYYVFSAATTIILLLLTLISFFILLVMKYWQRVRSR